MQHLNEEEGARPSCIQAIPLKSLRSSQALLLIIALFLVVLICLECLQLAVLTTASHSLSTSAALPKSADFLKGIAPPVHISVQTLFGLAVDNYTGKVYIQVPHHYISGATDFLYSSLITAGMGSGQVLLDRGEYIQRPRVVRFRRSSARQVSFLTVQVQHISSSPDPLHVASIADSFAPSLLTIFNAVAEDDSGVLLDITPFLLNPPLHYHFDPVAGLPSYHLVSELSTIDSPNCRAFPANVELSTWVAYQGDASRVVQASTGDQFCFTLQVRHSFAALPAASMQTRMHAANCGLYAQVVMDHASPFNSSRLKSYVVRHRLERDEAQQPTIGTNGQKLYVPLKPIAFYLDPSTPSPFREAVLEGASWWQAAFEAAGWKDAFKVDVLPSELDMYDMSYNIIEWTYRSSRSWSYGQPLVDQRTGEIIRGYIVLGDGRSHQDYVLASAMLGDDSAAMDVVLSRLRQLAAHEVGHVLGLCHNFAGSFANHSSVMDYPAMSIQIGTDGNLDGSKSYATGLGPWDFLAIEYAYAVHADEAAGTAKTLTSLEALPFVTEDDGSGSAPSPAGCQWDSGNDAFKELATVMEVRRVALNRMVAESSSKSIHHEYFTAAYLWHRYQVACTAKTIGGIQFSYGGARALSIPFSVQQRALDAVLTCLDPKELYIPVSLLQAMPPMPPNFQNGPDLFTDSKELLTRPGGHDRFDPSVAAYVAAELVFDSLLDPQRIVRLLLQEQAGDAGTSFGLSVMLRQCVAIVFRVADPIYDIAAMAVQEAFVDGLVLSRQQAKTTMVAAMLEDFISKLSSSLVNCDYPGMLLEACLNSSMPLWVVHYTALKKALGRSTPSPYSIPIPRGPPI